MSFSCQPAQPSDHPGEKRRAARCKRPGERNRVSCRHGPLRCELVPAKRSRRGHGSCDIRHGKVERSSVPSRRQLTDVDLRGYFRVALIQIR